MKVDFFRAVRTAATEAASLYRGTIADRRSLAAFLEMNGWYGLTERLVPDQEEEAVRTGAFPLDEADVQILLGHLGLWLKAYHRDDHEKLMILAEYGRERFPKTTASFLSFARKAGLDSETVTWRLLDYLIGHLEKEIVDMRFAELDSFISGMSREASLSACELFADYYEAEIRKGEGWIYRFAYRSKREGIEAYPLMDFARMQYCTFNKENWESESMIGKACSSPAYANLWAFISLHFVCALRATDIERLPKPQIPCPGQEFRRRILEESGWDTGEIARELKIRMRLKPLLPNKTRGTQHVPDLKVFIPVSLETPMGLILGIAASFCDDVSSGNPFIHSDTSLTRIRSFFGRQFAEALGGRRFSTNKANKAYLQGIEMVADSRGRGQPKGYMLAALARSHKGGIAKLPATTEIYLRDAAFSGYSPQFIAKEMFERGVFGFVPHLLLVMYGGESYRALDVHGQTGLIRELGLAPSAIEQLVRLNESSLLQARETVGQVAAGKIDIPEILQKIACGEAVSRVEGLLCLMTACGYPCAEKDRATCIGCRYEICTKSILHAMVSEYVRLRSHFEDEDGWRYKAVAGSTIMKMVGEFVGTMKLLYPEEDTEMLTRIIKGGLEGYVGCSEQTEGSELQPLPDRQGAGR